MKKLTTILLLSFSAFILVGCAKTTEAPTTKASVTTTETPGTTTEAPLTTTEAPGSTTEAPGSTTEAPQTTTKEPTTTQGGNTTALDTIEAFDLGGKTIRIASKRASYYDYKYSNLLDPTKIRSWDDNTEYWEVLEATQKYIENKYNCKIEWVDLTTITEANLWTHLQNVYASGDIYDICEISGEEFPYMYMNDMVQYIPDDLFDSDVADLFWGGEEGFQYSAYTHLDKKWGVGSSNSIWDVEQNSLSNTFTPMLFYNIDLLEEAGIEKMPSEYWQEGTWSWEVFEDMCLKVVNNIPGKYGLLCQPWGGGLENFLGSNGTFVFDDYGNMGFYSKAAQEVYSQWSKWQDNGVLYKLEYAGQSQTPTNGYYNQRWFGKDQGEQTAFVTGRLSFISSYWKDVNLSCVPFPYGPSAEDADGNIDLDAYKFNVDQTGLFWTVPKGKDVRLYQILGEFYNGLRAYNGYKNCDDLDATVEDIVCSLFPIDEWDYIIDLYLYIQENMNFMIIQSAVPAGIFRQAVREHYNKGSAFYGEMWNYMQAHQIDISETNPNNFWLCIFGEPGNLPVA